MNVLAYSLMAMGGLGLFFAAALAVADRKLRVQEDPRIALALDATPGANCGGCGYAGCAAYAEAIVTEGAAINLCPPGGQETADKLAAIMGVDAVVSVRQVARLMCRGSSAVAKEKAEYEGPGGCAVQDLVSGGGKACQWGCLGGGDCVEVCAFGALEMGADGLPVVFEDLCTACNACVKECPRGLFELHPVTREFFVFCKSHDEPKRSRDVCDVACFGCGICVRASQGAITLVDGLAVIDHGKLDPSIIPIGKCRTGAIGWLRPKAEESVPAGTGQEPDGVPAGSAEKG